MEEDVVGIGLSLLQAPEGARGNMTSGGTESIMLAVKTCRDEARSRGVDTNGAEIVAPASVHPAFDKAAHYLGLRVVRVPVAKDFGADVGAMADAHHAPHADAGRLGALLPLRRGRPDRRALRPRARARRLAARRRVRGRLLRAVRAHERRAGAAVLVRAAGVRSISADLHKYGYVAKGASTVFHRSEAQWQHQVFAFDRWPAGGMLTPTVAGTRPGGAIASAWAVLHYLGVEGYREKARQVVATREKLMKAIDATDGLRTHGAPLLGLFTYGATDVDPFAIWARMVKRGWFSGLCTEPRGIHLMLSPAHAGVADQYLADLASSLAEVRATSASGADVKASYA